MICHILLRSHLFTRVFKINVISVLISSLVCFLDAHSSITVLKIKHGCGNRLLTREYGLTDRQQEQEKQNAGQVNARINHYNAMKSVRDYEPKQTADTR